jgi:hypothetical protein
MAPRRPRSSVVAALAVDALLLLAFAALGRRSHDEASGVLETLRVAAPFLAGWLLAAAVTGLVRRPLGPGTAVRAWAVGLPGGLLLRGVTGGGLAPAFVVVALVVNLATLVGWRVLHGLARRRANRGR